jgi:diadenosine tetraphosphate (Ap4A) HIT family hydrolase
VSSFALDHRLNDSSLFIDDWTLCRVALKNDTAWPWLYLVPRRDNIREIFELTPADQAQLVTEISLAGRALQEIYRADKINTAALGNMVPQCHIHVFARFKTDPAWPKPVWAVEQPPEIPYTQAQAYSEIEKLKNCFAKLRIG